MVTIRISPVFPELNEQLTTDHNSPVVTVASGHTEKFVLSLNENYEIVCY